MDSSLVKECRLEMRSVIKFRHIKGELNIFDWHITVARIAYETKLSVGSVVTITHDHLAMSKIMARWVPRLLTDEMKTERLRCSRILLNHVKDSPNFVDRLVTVDESWVYQYDPEIKYKSNEWRPSLEGSPRKAKRSRSSMKVMLTVFWDTEGVILTDFLTQGNTMNKERYSELILSLRTEYRKKRPQKQ